MNKSLSYKDYTGSVEFSAEDRCFFGRILLIEDIVTYEGTSVDDIEQSFHEAVDGYIAYCQQTGRPANKPYSGSFNVRTGQDLHRKLALEAARRGTTLNDLVVQCLKNGVEQNESTRIEQHTHHHNNIVIVDKQEAETMFATMEQPYSWGNTYAVH